MKRKYNNDYEKLSAYIDGELPLSEKNELEERLTTSAELREKLNSLRKIKELSSSSFKKLNESAYLDTRIMAAIKAGEAAPLVKRRWIPVTAVIILTAALMLVLKFNPRIINRLVEEQTTNLAAFYKENLKPLLYAANLSNEDIFNFAFYKELPLDNNDEQYLQLGNDAKGVEYFEIKNSSYYKEENNYDRFVSALNLDEKQIKSVDSILQYYAAELQAQVLVNDRNTVAINPNLWNYNKAIAADLVKFASQLNEPELRKIIPSADVYLHAPAMEKLVVEVKSNNDNNYIFLTPDTIFTSWVDFDGVELKKDLRIAKEEIRKAGREMNIALLEKSKEIRKDRVAFKLDSLRHKKDKRFKRSDFEVVVGDNNYRVELQGLDFPDLPDMDSVSAHVERVLRNVQVYTNNSPKTSSKISRRYNFQYGYGDSTHQVIIPQTTDIDSLMKYNYNYIDTHNKYVDSVLSHYMPRFRMNQDSLTTYFKMYGDSTDFFNESELKIQMKEMEVELKRFREEMQNLRKDLKRDSTKEEKKKVLVKPIEI